MTSCFVVVLGLLVFTNIPAALRINPINFNSSILCEKFNDNCNECINVTQRKCYFCGNKCIEDGGVLRLFSMCPVRNLYAGQCNLSVLGTIVLSCMAILCCSCCSCCTVVIYMCCCDCSGEDSGEYNFASNAARNAAKISMLKTMNKH